MAGSSFQIDDGTVDWIDSRLVPGQSKSTWYRYATKTTMIVDHRLDDLYEGYEYDKRQEFINYAVKKEIDQALERTDESHTNLVDNLENGKE